MFVCGILIIATLSNSGCINEEEKEEKIETYEERHYRYLLGLHTYMSKNFTINIPVPISENNTIPTDLIDNFIFRNGYGAFEPINTQYGPALKIILKQNMGAEVEFTSNMSTIYRLSMLDRNYSANEVGYREYWVYINSHERNLNISSLQIIFHSVTAVINKKTGERINYKSGAGKTEILSYHLINGWQIVTGKKGFIYAP